MYSDIDLQLAGQPDAPALRQLAGRLAAHLLDTGPHHDRAREIRDQLLSMHRQLYAPECAGLIETPLGWLGVVWSGHGLRRIVFPPASRAEIVGKLSVAAPTASLVEPPADLASWMRGYFGGQPGDAAPALDLAGLPSFRRRVLEVVASIPFGETRSYQWVAQQLGSRGYQAIGQANGANPVPIVIPCHRVVASDGSLHGYSGGLALKRWLLDHERACQGGQRVG